MTRPPTTEELKLFRFPVTAHIEVEEIEIHPIRYPYGILDIEL